MQNNKHRRRNKNSRGQTLIETAFILPILMLLSLVTVDGSRMMYAHNTMLQAARQAASDAARRPEFRSDYVVQEGTTLDQAQAAAIQNIKDFTLNYLNSRLNPNLAPQIDISVPGVGNALNALENPIQVTITTNNFELITGSLLPPDMNKKPTITARSGSFIEQSKVAVPTKNYVENVPDLDGDGIENSIDTTPSTNCVNQGQGACCTQAAAICAEQCAEVTDFASCTDRCRILLETLCSTTDQCLVLNNEDKCTEHQLCFDLRQDEHCTPDELCIRDFPADHDTVNCTDEQKCRMNLDIEGSCTPGEICAKVYLNPGQYCQYCTDMCTNVYCTWRPECQCNADHPENCSESQLCWTLRLREHCTPDELCIMDYQADHNTSSCSDEQKCRLNLDIEGFCSPDEICAKVYLNPGQYCQYCTDMCTNVYCTWKPECQCTAQQIDNCSQVQQCIFDVSRCTDENQSCQYHIETCSDSLLCVYHPNDPRCTISS